MTRTPRAPQPSLPLLLLALLLSPLPAAAPGSARAQASDEEEAKENEPKASKSPSPAEAARNRLQRAQPRPATPGAAAGPIGSPGADAELEEEAAPGAPAPAASPGAPASSAAPTGPSSPAAPPSSGGPGAPPSGGPAASGDDDDDGAPAAAAPPAERKQIQRPPPDALIHIDYDKAELKDVIKDFAERTGRNFLIDPKISGQITIIAPQPVTVGEAYEAFLAALDANGYTTVVEARYQKDIPEKGIKRGDPMLTRILPAGDSKGEPLELYKDGQSPRSPTNNLITRLVKVENISAEELTKVLGKWVSSSGDMIAYAPSNTLIITDSDNNIRRMIELIKELDISAPRQKLEVIQIQYAEAARLVEIINEIYGAEAAGAGSRSGSAPAASSRATRKAGRAGAGKDDAGTATGGTAESVGSEASFIGKMMADERTNSIIVLATEKSMEEIRELIARLDYEVDPWAQSDIHVIYLEHAKAEELSQTLNNLIQQSNQRSQQRGQQGSGRGGSAAGGRGGDARGGRGGRAGAAAGGDGDAGGRSGDREGANPGLTPGAAGSLGGNFQSEVRITHDVPTNSLVITATRDDYRRLRRVIDLLDIARKQVFVETVIMEVSDQKRNDAGVSWHGGRPANDTGNPGAVSIIGARGGQSINLASSLLDGSLLGGLALGIFGNGITVPLPGVDGGLQIPAFGVVIRALQEDSSTNVLSAPNILTLDNEEATIEIGETVPFPSAGLGGLGSLAGLAGAAGAGGLSGLSGLGGFPSVSFRREDVGIILRITPQINESDWVTMSIYQEISEVKEGSGSESGGGPTTTKRSAETNVSVRSNQTIVIGGLMQEVETEGETKVPILGDIPLIGALFREKKKTKRKTNLLIFLTPHVIDGPEDLQEVYRIKMAQREEFMRRFYGKSPEEQRKELEELMRFSMNLPETPSVYRDKPLRPRQEVDLDDMTDDELREALDHAGAARGEVIITPEGELPVNEVPPPATEEGTDPRVHERDEPGGEGGRESGGGEGGQGGEGGGEGGSGGRGSGEGN
jgi:general secretion pathway protein D